MWVGAGVPAITGHSCESRNPDVLVGQASSLSKNDGQDARPTKTGRRIESGGRSLPRRGRRMGKIASEGDG